MPRVFSNNFTRSLIILMGISILAPTAWAATTRTWTGLGGDDKWTTAANWDTNPTAPQPGDDLVFVGTTQTTNTNDYPANTAFNSITFNDTGFTLNGNAVNITGGGSAIALNSGLDGPVNFNLDVTFQTSAPTIAVPGASGVRVLMMNGAINNNGFLITANVARFADFTGIISGSGGFTLSGGGFVHLKGAAANTYFGTTTVSSGTLELFKSPTLDCFAGNLVINNTGTVALQNDDQIPDGVSVTINSGGQLDLNEHVETINLATSAGNISLGSLSSAVLTLKQLANATYSGNISGQGGAPTVFKQGTGTLVLTGDNTGLLGNIEIDAGTLEVDGNAAGVLINPKGGTLSGTGSVGFLSPVAGGTVSPGAPANTPGNLTVDDMQLDSSTTVNIQLDGVTAGSQYDQITVSTADFADINGAALNVTTGFPVPMSSTYTILNVLGGASIGGTFNGLAEGGTFNTGGFTFQITYMAGNGNEVMLTRVPMNTTTSIVSSKNPSDENVNVTFTATIAPVAGGATPTGTVQFQVSGSNLGTPVTLDGAGQATSIATQFSSAGDFRIDAIYSGDTAYNGSSNFIFEHTGHISSPLSAIATPGQSFLYTIQSDVSGESVSVTGLPPSGNLHQNPMVNTEIIGTPDAGDIGSYTVHISIQAFGWATADVSLIVDTQPTANAQGPLTVEQDVPLGITLGGSDADGQTLTFSIGTQPAHGTISGTGANITYSPSPGYTGSDSFTFKTNDGLLDSAPATVDLNVVRFPPTITSAANASGTEGSPFSFTITTTGTAPVTINVANLPSGLSFNGSTISGTPAAPGTTHVTVTASNGVSPDASQDLVITISPGPLHFTSPDTAVGKVGTGFSYEMTASGTPPYVFSAKGVPEGLSFDRSTISGTPKTEGTFTVNMSVSGGNNESATLDLTITIASKSTNLPPEVSKLAIEPSPGVVNDDVFFLAVANDPENAALTYAWDFGDGTTSAGALVSHAYAAAGAYTVSVAVSDGVSTTTKTQSLTIDTIDPNAPRITDVVPSANPAHAGDAITFDASVVDPNGASVTLTWNFGDGSAFGHGPSVTHTFAANGDYVVTVTAVNANNFTARPFNLFFFVVDAGGVKNVLEQTQNPLNGLAITLGDSSNGVTRLDISVDALREAAFDVETNFGIPGRFKVPGKHPTAKFEKAAIYVATTVAKDATTREAKGKARKTIPISAKEVGAPTEFTADPPSRKIQVDSLKGNFLFGRTGAATGPKSIPDQVTLGGRITLPAGLKLDHPQEVHIAVGNVVDRIVMDPKGKGQGKFSKLGLKGGKAAADGTKEGKFKVSMRLAGMTTQGFDTEGVDPHPKSEDLNIQCAILVGGETYYIDTPVKLKVTPKFDKGLISGRGP